MVTATPAKRASRGKMIWFFISSTRRQHDSRAQKLDFVVERMCELLAEQHAPRIPGERGPALLDRSIDDLEISFDDRNGGGVELRLPLAHDPLKQLDFLSIYDIRVSAGRLHVQTHRPRRRPGLAARILCVAGRSLITRTAASRNAYRLWFAVRSYNRRHHARRSLRR